MSLIGESTIYSSLLELQKAFKSGSPDSPDIVKYSRNISKLDQKDRVFLSQFMHPERLSARQLVATNDQAQRLQAIVSIIKNDSGLSCIKKLRNCFNHIGIKTGIRSDSYIQSASLAEEMKSLKAEKFEIIKELKIDLNDLPIHLKKAVEAKDTKICVRESVEIPQYETDSSGSQFQIGSYTQEAEYRDIPPDELQKKVAKHKKGIENCLSRLSPLKEGLNIPNNKKNEFENLIKEYSDYVRDGTLATSIIEKTQTLSKNLIRFIAATDSCLSKSAEVDEDIMIKPAKDH